VKTKQTSFYVDEVTTFAGNPRQGDVDAIAESLTKHGQYRTIVVNTGTHTGRPNEVLAGNHTLLAARKLGWESIDATVVDVDDAMCRSIVAADNRLADKGGYDEQALLELLEGLDGNLIGTGYDDSDVQDLRDLLGDGDMWERNGVGGGDGHSDDDDAKFHPEIKLTVDNAMFDAWRQLLEQYQGKDDVAKLRAHLVAQGAFFKPVAAPADVDHDHDQEDAQDPEVVGP
jgi:hypothetical protein